ncbi:response regulator receiver protein [Planococcus halocryophilus Or1]|uniref:GGDEF domain-containing protein n=1 Tax=Planococcus halocryophilus TaxID=1215089 RepID=A0A1C7DSQ9_9BACL|nr:GGDEF domain-containing protein [Planococcus halocryophilus]ANU14368.1 GGDEF domain-containing protein [Planococcus halocryophilus]EMF46132.1 response regulator receiver protein [Planococcus halocryophilus Or1]
MHQEVLGRVGVKTMEQQLDRAPCGYLVLDRDLRIVEINNTLRNLTGVENPHHIHDLLTIASRMYFQTYFTPSIKMHGTVNEMFLTLKSTTGSMPALMNAVDRGGYYECAMIQMSVRGEYEKELLMAKRNAEKINRETADAYDKLQALMNEVENKQQELLALNLELQQLAITDSLTGLKNRRYLEERLTHFLVQAEKGREVAVLVLDIDYFKRVNDTHGHQIGDAVLQELARRLEEVVGSNGIVTRFGGEEFVIIMPDVGAKEGLAKGNAICKYMESVDWINVPVTVSIGVAVYMPGDEISSWLSRADSYLYKAKADGRNCAYGLI